MATNRTAKEEADIVQKKVDEDEANNAEIGDQFWIYSGQRLEVERPKEELEKRANTLRDMIENVRDGIPPGGRREELEKRADDMEDEANRLEAEAAQLDEEDADQYVVFVYLDICTFTNRNKIYFTYAF